MFDTNAVKSMAKNRLARNWKVNIYVSIVYIVVSYVISYSITNKKFFDEEFSLRLFLKVMAFFMLFEVFDFIKTMYYAKYTISEKPEGVLFSDFTDKFEYWFVALKAVLYKYFCLFLWYFLFIIPAVIKYFSYSQMTYILAENPNIPVRKAMKMSIAMTNGYKGQIFSLYLSFIGWKILSVYTKNILELWVDPYKNITFVYFYYYLKELALKNGTLSIQDFETN